MAQGAQQSFNGRRRASEDTVTSQDLSTDYVPVQPHRSAYNAAGSGFIGGVALENYRRGLKAAQTSTPTDGQTLPPPSEYRQRPTPVSNLASLPPPPPSQPYSQTVASLPNPSTKSTTPAPIPSRWSPSVGNTAAEAGPSAAALPMEPQRGKKGLPFLKNPMSTLLLRRKGQTAQQETAPQPLRVQTETLYDPRIKGTRVHDFGAPRASSSTPRLDHTPKLTHVPSHPPVGEAPKGPMTNLTGVDNGVNQTPPAHDSDAVLSTQTMPSASQHIRYSDLPVQEEDGASGHIRLASTDSISTSKSSKIRRSRNVSLSTIPKHMKSTSSRFSFVVGPTGQEKIMEEKHRQREIEKQETEEDFRPDSRFDELEDDFDYDAMMDDDGLEERIPGVNASDDEDDGFGLQDQYLDEPSYVDEGVVPSQQTYQDDDHEKTMLSQFVFQQSNPSSLHPSPQVNDGLLPTPRDANGNIIGSALTKDTPTMQTFPLAPQAGSTGDDAELANKISGLGIETHGAPMLENHNTVSRETASNFRDDDMYFDDGLLGYEDEFAEDLAVEPEYSSAPFDESIFDLDDTDQYGRPLPGAFAKAQSLRREANAAAANRESDLTSGVSAHSVVSRSTAHTSISDKDTIAASSLPHNDGQYHMMADSDAGNQPAAQGRMAVYQAALAAAAHEAAASGKFCRAGSPELPPSGEDDQFEAPNEHDYYNDDEFGYENMDEFELDDEAIIAEANATALANDSDGWYGQEFGFYSSPHRNATQKTSEMGGFFGPKGLPDLARSASGRLISREPNLTPITERSEYSNRNSIMSMGLPGLQAGTPTVQSPGLAQLAMLAEYGDEDMSLSALMRLRSKAWGGSQASLSSSKEGSPRSERGELPSSPWGTSQPATISPAMASGHVRQNSNYSAESRDSDIGSSPSSSNMGMSHSIQHSNYTNLQAARQPGNPLRGNSAPAAYRPGESRLAHSSVPEAEEETIESAPGSAMPGRNSNEWTWGQDGITSSAGTIPTSKRGKGHRRHNSSADSISYIMEEEEGGDTRWIMERRRISSNGQVEILEREVFDKGRI